MKGVVALILGFCVFSSGKLANAQSLVLKLNDNSSEVFPISEISSIKFETAAMVLRQTDGTSHTWEISDIDHYSFESGLGVKALPSLGEGALTVFPNPASGQIKIRFSLEAPNNIKIVLLDVSGRQVSHLFSGRHEGTKDYLLPINLPAGTYYCQVMAGEEMISKPIVIK